MHFVAPPQIVKCYPLTASRGSDISSHVSIHLPIQSVAHRQTPREKINIKPN